MSEQMIRKSKLIDDFQIICGDVSQKHPDATIDFDRDENLSFTGRNIALLPEGGYVFTKPPITIGMKPVYDAPTDENGNIPIIYLVDCVKVLFHELQHVNQYTSLFQQEKTDATTINMARRDLIAICFPNYYHLNYYHQPCELDAEQHGFTGTVEYFQQHPEYLNNETDVKQTLFNMYKNLQPWYLPTKYRMPDYNSMVKNLGLLKKLELQANRKFEHIDYDENHATRYQLAEKVLNNPEYKNYLKAFNEAPNGIEQDKILLQAILREDPNVATLYKCLEPECKAYLKAFKHTDKSTVIPSSQVYSIMSQKDVHADRINHLEDKFSNVLADDALKYVDYPEFK